MTGNVVLSMISCIFPNDEWRSARVRMSVRFSV
jgi:hypothetical protein